MQKQDANKNAKIKAPIENLQAAKRNQLQQTAIGKIGNGGARAARRIWITNTLLEMALAQKRSGGGVTPHGAFNEKLPSMEK